MLTREEYLACLKGLLSRDANSIRDANRTLFTAVVNYQDDADSADAPRTADLVLAEVAAG